MDRQHAKEILSRYRPGATLGDTELGEALEMARHDPQLAEWFAKYHAAQANAAANPDAALPPVADAGADREHAIPLAKPVLIMVGLAMVVGALLWSLLAGPKPKDPFISYRDRMARLVQRSYPLTVFTSEQSQIRDYFRTNAGPADFTLPRNLEKLPGKGCAVFTWNSHPVGLIGLDGGTNTTLYVFLIPRAVFETLPFTDQPAYARVGRLLTASWVNGDQIYLLTGPDDLELMKSYFE